jgi:hypothetical protein
VTSLPGRLASTEARIGRSTVKKFLFWTAVIAGILAAVAVMMKRRSGQEDGSWEYLEAPKEPVSKAVSDTLSGPDTVERAKDTVDAAAEGTKDVIDLTADTSKDVADEAKDAAAKAKRGAS